MYGPTQRERVTMDTQQVMDALVQAESDLKNGVRRTDLSALIVLLRRQMGGRPDARVEQLFLESLSIAARHYVLGSDKRAKWQQAMGVYTMLRKRTPLFRVNLHAYGATYLNWAIASLGSGEGSLAFSYAQVAMGYLADGPDGLLTAKAQLVAAMGMPERQDYVNMALAAFRTHKSTPEIDELVEICHALRRGEKPGLLGRWFHAMYPHLGAEHMVGL